MNPSKQEYINQVISESLPGNSIECVILAYENQQLKTLLFLSKHDIPWSLPGGYIKKEEHMDEAAHRILKERAGLKSIFLNQIYTFGNKDRSPINSIENKKNKLFVENLELDENKLIIEWFSQRLITTCYYALVDIKKYHPKPDMFFEKCEWVSIDKLPKLFLNQNKTVEKVLSHLKTQLNYLPIGISLLPKKFTMQDLQRLYEIILQKPLVRSNFQRKMLSLGIFTRLEKQMTGASNKAPYLYCFNEKKYNDALEKGIGFYL